MGNSKFINKLKKFSKTARTAKKRAQEEGFGNQIDDGMYKAKITSCQMKESNAGELHMVFEFQIVSGENKGHKEQKWCKVESEDDQVWLGRDLARFGIELPDDLTQLVEIAEIINDSGAEVKIQLKTKDSGQFCYINRVLDEIDFGDAAEATEEDEEDEDEDEDDADDEEDADEDEDEEEDADEEEESEDEEEEDDEESEDEDEDEEAEEEEDEAEEEDDETELEVGMKVAFEGKSGSLKTGKIVKLLESQGKVKVKVGTKTFTVSAENLSLPEEEEPAPAKKAAKKKAPAKKKTAKKKVTKKKAAKRK